MSTTTIRLPDELKERIAKAAERAGKTTHALILEAIAEKAEQEEQHAAFEAEADSRLAKIAATGESIPWADMRDYLQQRVKGEAIKRPVVKKNRA